jgi:hypothetical protein
MGNLDSIYVDPTIEAVHRAIEARAAAEPPRTYLGASSLGDRCERKLYYRLNGAPSEPRKASLIYAAEDGHTSEATVAGRLRLVPGLELWTVDEVGKQFGFTDFGGKFAGHIDGVIKGLIQAPSTPHIWENKAANEKKFAEFRSAIQKYGEKQALMNGNYAWYVQAQCYMGYFDMTRHYLTVCTPGARDILSCRTEFVPAFFQAMRQRAERILSYREPPARLIDDPSYFYCKWCEFREHCHGETQS